MEPYYTAKVKAELLLELPLEAAALHLKPGDKVRVQLLPISGDLRKARPSHAAGQLGGGKPKALRGRGILADVLSSEEFMRVKIEEIAREDRRAR